MKKLFVTMVALIAATVTWGQSLDTELKTTLKSVLRKAGYETKFYENDRSMNINDNGVNYWFTLQNTPAGLYELTVNQKGFAVKGQNGKNRNVAPVIRAINEVNTKYFGIKAVLAPDTTRVTIETQLIVKSTSDLNPDVVGNIVARMAEARKTFDSSYKAFNTQYEAKMKKKEEEAKEKADTIILLDQQTYSTLVLNDVQVCSVESNESPITDYNHSIRKDEAKFVKTLLTLTPKQPGRYTIKARIVDAKGRAMLTSKDARYTIETEIEVKQVKKDRAYDFELPKIGSPTGKEWQKGEYTIDLWEGENVLGSKTFRIE